MQASSGEQQPRYGMKSWPAAPEQRWLRSVQVAGSGLVWGGGAWERAGEEEGGIALGAAVGAGAMVGLRVGEEEGVISLGAAAGARAMVGLRAGEEAGAGADWGAGAVAGVRTVVGARVGAAVEAAVEGVDVVDSRARAGVACAAGAGPEARSQLPGPAAALSAPDRSFPNVCVQ